jgi:hypothetical protein
VVASSLVLSAVVVVAAVVLGIVGHRSKREDAAFTGGLIAVLLGALIWVPESLRTLVVGVVLVMIIWDLGVTTVVIVGGILAAAGFWLPGGISVLVLGIMAIVGLFAVRTARAHVRRIERAADIHSGEVVDVDIELTGRARAATPITDPVDDKPCALWQVMTDKGIFTSEALIELRGDRGSAIVDPSTVDILWRRESRAIDHEKAATVGSARDIAIGEPGTGWMTLRVLPDDTECYVIGKPEWKLAPPGTGGLYRDSPLLPTFASKSSTFTDRSEAQLRLDYAWSIATWSTWGAVCAAIAAVQIAGW